MIKEIIAARLLKWKEVIRDNWIEWFKAYMQVFWPKTVAVLKKMFGSKVAEGDKENV